MRLAPFASALGCVAITAATAFAEPTPSEKAAATELFKQGRELMARGSYSQACPKLAESHRLDPSGGTVLNLGLCYEAEGKLASAWTVLNEALGVARREGRADREQVALDRIAAVEPRLSRLSIDVSPAMAVEGIEVRHNGSRVGRAAWGAALPVDRGSHRVDVTAPGRKSWSATIEIDADAETKVVSVPLLPAEGAKLTPRRRDRAAPLPPAPEPVQAEIRDADSGRTLAYVLGGSGVAALAVGGAFGVLALQSYALAEDECPTRASCTDDAMSLRDRAGTQATIANLCIAGGLALAGISAYLLLDSEPTVGARSFKGAGVSGRF